MTNVAILSIAIAFNFMLHCIASQIDIMLRCIKVKKRYIALVKRSRHASDASAAAGTTGGGGAMGGGGGGAGSAFTAQDELELRRIEETVPIQALIVFRQFAAFEMVGDMKREEKEALRKRNILSSLGWTSNAHSGTERSTATAAMGKEKGREKYRDREREQTGSKSYVSTSSLSSWLNFNLKKSKGVKDVESKGKNQKYSKSLNRTAYSADSDNDEVDDERLISLIQERLDVNVDPLAADQFMFRLQLNGSAALRLASEGRPVALLELAMSSSTEMKADGMMITFALDDFHILDECTESPLVKYLIISPTGRTTPAPPKEIVKPTKTKEMPVNPFLLATDEPKSYVRPRKKEEKAERDGKAPKLLFVMDSRHNRTVIRLTVRPIEATWNELCVERLLGIFMSPDVTHNTAVPSSSSSSFSPLLAASMSKFALDGALPIDGELELIIEIDAPKIIIPDDCFKDRGCLLADAGYLVVRGTYVQHIALWTHCYTQ